MEWQKQKQWIILRLIDGLGIKGAEKLLSRFEHPEAIFNMPQVELDRLPKKLQAILQALKKQGNNHLYAEKAEQIIAHTNKTGWQLVTRGCENYPQQLKQIPFAPQLLFVKGNVNLLASPQLAIVGARKASVAALKLTDLWSQALSQRLTITSGLALGVDAAAHLGAIAVEGRTIAVLAHGLDTIYPKNHHYLAEQIVDLDGALVTEFLPYEMVRRDHFPRRNRIISGLSLGVLLVEAAIKSGSLITAQYALEQNRDVFAVPGSLANPLAAGCHLLIKQGAQLVDTVDDILTHWRLPEEKTVIKTADIPAHLTQLWAYLPYDFIHIDEILTHVSMSPEDLNTGLSELELESYIEIQGASVRKIQ